MNHIISQKIELLNQKTLDSLTESNRMKIIEEFTEAGITIVGADFGFAWWKTPDHEEYKLVYTSEKVPYTPNPPREKGGNFEAANKRRPIFVEEARAENYEPGYDVSPYMKSYVIIPIAYNDYLYGSIVLCFTEPHVFSEEDRGLAASLGTAAAQAITINRLVISEHEARIDSEQKEAYFKALVENSQEVILLVGRKGQILYVSPSVKNIYGFDPEEVTGKNVTDLIYQKDTEDILKHLEKIANNTVASKVKEFQFKDSKGSIRNLESISTNMIDNPHVGGIVVNIRDITERKKLEHLKDTERLLEQGKLKTEFISNATHEFRTPLAIIRGNTDLAIRDLGQVVTPSKVQSVKESLKAIGYETEHLANVLSDLTLLLSQDERLQSMMLKKEVDLSLLLSTIIARYSVIAKEKKISIESNLSPVVLHGDAVYLEKLFANLIRNAITYGNEEGWIRVEVIPGETEVTVKVADNGIGIGEEDLPHIFERFYRADKSHNSEIKNTGLGLAITKWAAEMHGGSIEVESEEGKGSAFIVKLPI